MDPEKIGKKIRQIRQKSNMSQQEFAAIYGVSYQAVSKWENGKSIPDILVIKKICEDYSIDMNDLLDDKEIPTKKKINNIVGLFLCAIIVILGGIYGYMLLVTSSKKVDFEFKTLSTRCENFTLYGSIAYNEDKASIYIPNITYCGGDDDEVYSNIKCTFYETENKIQKEIASHEYSEDKAITLEEFLKDLTFHIDNYEKVCKTFKENTLSLEIEATKEDGKTTSYKIPLTLEDSCN